MELRVVRPTSSPRAIAGGNCESELYYTGHFWSHDRFRKPCTKRARFLRVEEGVVIERLCGVHANVAIRWQLVGEVRPIVQEVP